MVTKTPLTKRIVLLIARIFLEDSGYKADLHKDLVALLLELKDLTDAVHEVLGEYRSALTLIRVRKPVIKKEREED